MAKTPNRAQSGAQDKADAQDDTIQGGPAHEADQSGERVAQESMTIGGDVGADGHTLSLNRDDSHEPHSGALPEAHEPRSGAHILLPNERERIVYPGSLIITCQEPGFRRAGIAHPAFAVHDADRFSPNQIAQLRNESKLTVIEIG